MKRIVLFLLAAMPAAAFAQANYQPGYILKNSGDTVKGFINYQEWAYSPMSVEFKLNKTDNETQEFSPGKIKGFAVYGVENYASFVGLLSMNKNIFPDIPTGLDTTRKPGEIFMRQLATGDHLILYANAEIHKNRFFIAEKDGAVAELKYNEYYGATNSEEVVDNLFRGQLTLYVYKYNNGDKSLLASIADVRFEERDLLNIVDKINNIAPGSKTDTLRNNIKTKTRFFGGLGLNEFTSAVNASSQSVFKPKFDFGLDVFINPDIQQFIFRTELAFSTIGGQYNQTATTPNNDAVDLSYEGSYMTITPQILFAVYNKPNLKIYIDGGIAFNIATYSNNQNGGDSGYINGYATDLYVPLQVGVIVDKKYELSFTFSSFSTGAFYANAFASNKLNGGMGFKMLF